MTNDHCIRKTSVHWYAAGCCSDRNYWMEGYTESVISFDKKSWLLSMSLQSRYILVADVFTKDIWKFLDTSLSGESGLCDQSFPPIFLFSNAHPIF